MIKILLSFIIVLVSYVSKANKIDEIRNDKDVMMFFKKYAPDNYVKYARIIPDSLLLTKTQCSDAVKSLGMKSWQKVDFNNDGLTDILINVLYSKYNSIVFIDMGNGKFDMNVLSNRWSANCQFGTVINKDGRSCVLMYLSKQVGGTVAEGYKPVITLDTLMYEHGAFAEINSKPSTEAIGSVVFYITGCLGDCPSYELKINANKEATLSFTTRLNNDKVLNFDLKDATLNQVFGFISYLDVKKLKDSYTTSTTDSRTAILTVNFKDGTVKKINDYALIGTYGLSGLYKIFERIRETKWK